MYDNGVTLLPGQVDVDATRGHPLFFYAAAAFWMKIFGTSLVAKHSFALLISVALIAAIYIICYQLFNYRVALGASFLLSSQIIFFVQSSMLLPEVMIALLFLTSLYFFVTEKYIPLAVSLALLLLTKESGLVLGLVLGVAFIFSLFTKQTHSKQQNLKMFIALLIPALIIIAFFIFQKSIYGWYFFPEHIGLMDTQWEDVSARFQSMLLVIFTEEKRK